MAALARVGSAPTSLCGELMSALPGVTDWLVPGSPISSLHFPAGSPRNCRAGEVLWLKSSQAVLMFSCLSWCHEEL